ncbi:MAG: HAMP domain-containing histidine kinase [Clostridiales bacterium]|nr:HAMP domain-containing histidine kinase [Clostridiales bacterium]
MAATLLFSLGTYAIYRAIIFSVVDRRLENQYETIMHDIERVDEVYSNNLLPDERPKPRDPDYRIPFSMPDDVRMLVFVYHQDGTLIYRTSNQYFENFHDTELTLKDKVESVSIDGYNFRAIGYQDDNYEAMLLYNVDSELRSLTQLMIVLMMCLIGFCVISILLAQYLSGKAMKPIEDSYIKQTEFVQDASHEMRTPLAVIKSKIELLATKPQDSIESHYEDFALMMSEIVSMEKMNKNLLMLSKADYGDVVQINAFALSDLLTELEEFFTLLAEGEEKEFTVQKPEDDFTVSWDYDKMKQALTILLDNAFKYTAKGAHISLLVPKTNHREVVIEVVDDGIGIGQESQKRIFDRFYRSDDARASEIEGSGIGLSILQAISKKLHFNVDVISQKDAGTTFQLTIPRRMK